MQALVLDREARASTFNRRPVHQHKRPRHRSGARPLLRRSSTGTGLEQQPDVESTTLAGAKLQAVRNGLGAPRCREGWQTPAAGQARTGAVCAWNAARRAFSVSALSSLRLTSGSPVTSSTPGVRGGANFSWYERPLAGWIQRPVTRSTYVRQELCR